MKIHDVFHVDLLVPFKETEAYGQAHTRPPPDLIDGEEEYEVEEILGHRMHRPKKQYLIKWKGYPSSDNSWEDATNVHAQDLVAEYNASL